MNSDASCHEIVGCPGVYVDAFRGRFASKTQDASCSFILTHYHGDHYSGLPRDGKYQGPALIHCTPVTAALLRIVHGVPSEFVREHDYGISFRIKYGAVANDDEEQVCPVTFYDANHCPGAAIVLFELADGTFHLHTGDMRYHPKMKEYPLLRGAVENKRLDLVYLDTTYGHPKHEFVAQDDAVEAIASQVSDLLGTSRRNGGNDSDALVLLSCYSIGKEKVLWRASTESDQLVHVTETKYKMLQCVEQHQDTDISSRIVERCTLEPSKSDLHVIPMGMAGELWPYFQPNHRACLEYAQKLEKRYKRVVAFLPTGWAVGSNWNKKNAVSTRNIQCGDGESVLVEIRLVSYSEHSAFSELCTFVEYLRPRKVVPTVFSEEKDRRRIEGYFRNMVDGKRAKQQFFKSMRSVPLEADAHKVNHKKSRENNSSEPVALSKSTNNDASLVALKKPSNERTSNAPESRKRKLSKFDNDELSTLVSMGFDVEAATVALEKHNHDMEIALDSLLSKGSAHVKQPEQQFKVTKKASQSPPPITRYFTPKSR